MTRSSAIGITVFLVLGIACVVFGIFMFRAARRLREYRRVEGVIVQASSYPTGTGTGQFRTEGVVEWTAHDGVRRKLRIAENRNSAFSEGQKREVLYDPDNPDRAVLGGASEGFFRTIGFLIPLIIGATFIVIALRVLIRECWR